jgi:hypothetical protein
LWTVPGIFRSYPSHTLSHCLLDIRTEIRLPVSDVTCVLLVGQDLADLHVTTSGDYLDGVRRPAPGRNMFRLQSCLPAGRFAG